MQITISKTDLRAVVAYLTDYIAQGAAINQSTVVRNKIRMATLLKRKLEKKLPLS